MNKDYLLMGIYFCNGHIHLNINMDINISIILTFL
jgi:hypothetical protein